jgi:T-complex protein 1 subunit alpha
MAFFLSLCVQRFQTVSCLSDAEFFANMVVDAVCAVKTNAKDGSTIYPINAINILKSHGKSAHDSVLIDGYALNNQRSAQGMPKSVKNAKIALLDIDLRKSKMNFGVQVVVDNPDELERIRQRFVSQICCHR